MIVWEEYRYRQEYDPWSLFPLLGNDWFVLSGSAIVKPRAWRPTVQIFEFHY